MLAGGNPPVQGLFTALHILSLMNSDACNGTYGSRVGGALVPLSSAVAFDVRLIIMLQRELFVVFEALFWKPCPFSFRIH